MARLYLYNFGVFVVVGGHVMVWTTYNALSTEKPAEPQEHWFYYIMTFTLSDLTDELYKLASVEAIGLSLALLDSDYV